jgi:hypothetical protein
MTQGQQPSEWLDAFLHEAGRSMPFKVDPSNTESGRAILALPKEEQVPIVLALVARQVNGAGRMVRVDARNIADILNQVLQQGSLPGNHTALKELLSALLRKKLPFSRADLEYLVGALAGLNPSAYWTRIPPAGILGALETFVADQGLPDSLRDLLQQLQAKLEREADDALARKVLKRVEAVLRQAPIPMPAPEPANEDRAWVEKFLEEVEKLDRSLVLSGFQVRETESGGQILELPTAEQIRVILAGVARQVPLINGHDTCGSSELTALLQALLRKKLPFSLADLEQLIRLITRIERQGWWSAVAPTSILRAVEGHVDEQGVPDSLRDVLEQLAVKLREHTYYAEPRDLLKRVESLLDRPRAAAERASDPATIPMRRPAVQLTTDEAWTRRLTAALASMDAPSHGHWDALLAHCAKATSSKPSGKWLEQAGTLIQAIGPDAFAAVLVATLEEIGKPGTPPKFYILGQAMDGDPTTVHDTHSDLLRGLVWCASLVPHDEVIAALGTAADTCFRKIPGVGPRAPKIGNACLTALSGVSSVTAVGQLSRLKTRAKHVSIRKQLDKALDTAAVKTGMSAAELEEVAAPTCGLTAVGEYREQLGDFTALLRATDSLGIEILWHRPDGKTQASVPAAVREHHPAPLKALKQREKEIAKLLPAQRDRLEQQLLEQRSWSLPDFRSRFLDHPLVGVVARRLIWRFTDGTRTGDGIWHDGRLVDERGSALDWLGDAARVCLWHPLNAAVDRVKAWRDWLEAQEVRQPFKQAHREIYLLTDAERQTGAYSNRFAAHILKQHQFAALCQQRSWRYTLQGEWDSANTPMRALPQWDLRAEFWIEPIRAEPGPIFERADLGHTGVYVYVATDQVRFYPGDGPIPLPLAEVPPLVFSEIMRDVDLFVGVAGVGNDPTWADRGLTGRYREYWESYAFGDLFPSAQTRKAVLERIIPRLAIAGRCSFSDRFLIVQGDLRTYKIHLGSGNILMAPNDQYLCIVPRQGAASLHKGKVYLPFEGDAMLSIILSKALMLAADKEIKDPTILNQIGLRPDPRAI